MPLELEPELVLGPGLAGLDAGFGLPVPLATVPPAGFGVAMGAFVEAGFPDGAGFPAFFTWFEGGALLGRDGIDGVDGKVDVGGAEGFDPDEALVGGEEGW